METLTLNPTSLLEQLALVFVQINIKIIIERTWIINYELEFDLNNSYILDGNIIGIWWKSWFS